MNHLMHKSMPNFSSRLSPNLRRLQFLELTATKSARCSPKNFLLSFIQFSSSPETKVYWWASAAWFPSTFSKISWMSLCPLLLVCSRKERKLRTTKSSTRRFSYSGRSWCKLVPNRPRLIRKSVLSATWRSTSTLLPTNLTRKQPLWTWKQKSRPKLNASTVWPCWWRRIQQSNSRNILQESKKP